MYHTKCVLTNCLCYWEGFQWKQAISKFWKSFTWISNCWGWECWLAPQPLCCSRINYDLQMVTITKVQYFLELLTQIQNSVSP